LCNRTLKELSRLDAENIHSSSTQQDFHFRGTL